MAIELADGAVAGVVVDVVDVDVDEPTGAVVVVEPATAVVVGAAAVVVEVVDVVGPVVPPTGGDEVVGAPIAAVETLAATPGTIAEAATTLVCVSKSGLVPACDAVAASVTSSDSGAGNVSVGGGSPVWTTSGAEFTPVDDGPEPGEAGSSVADPAYTGEPDAEAASIGLSATGANGASTPNSTAT